MSSDTDDRAPRLPEIAPEQQEAFEATRRSLERLAERIVALPRENRELAFAAARKSLEDANREKGYEGHPAAERWLNEYMASLQIRVAEIEACGEAAGGNG
jgi:hypothetical protein